MGKRFVLCWFEWESLGFRRLRGCGLTRQRETSEDKEAGPSVRLCYTPLGEHAATHCVKELSLVEIAAYFSNLPLISRKEPSV